MVLVLSNLAPEKNHGLMGNRWGTNRSNMCPPAVRLVTGEYADAFLARYPEFKEQNRRRERSPRKRFADYLAAHGFTSG